jgi:hypothetical protein
VDLPEKTKSRWADNPMVPLTGQRGGQGKSLGMTRRWLPRMLAMAAGLGNHVFTLEGLLEYKHGTYQP